MKAASLTSTLLVTKGGAAPSGFLARPERSATVQALPIRPLRRAGGGKDEGHLRLSLRIGDARHRRLRLAAAHLHQSGHAVMMAALDHYLARVVPTLLDGPCRCIEEGHELGKGCTIVPSSKRPEQVR